MPASRARTGLARTADATAAALGHELQAGRAALAAGQVAMARAAFERALNLQPKDPGATQGIADAARLERVLALHSDAVRAEAAGQLQRAAELFSQCIEGGCIICRRRSPAWRGCARRKRISSSTLAAATKAMRH